MTSSIIPYQGTALATLEDFTFYPRLVPGNDMYERLLLQDPKKLKRMIREEQLAAADINTPEYQERARDQHRRAQERLAEDIASGKFAKRAEDFHRHRKNTIMATLPTPEDHALLGLDAAATKREVKNAFRRGARKLHPDKGGDEAAMKALNVAYKKVLAAAKA